MKRNIKDDCLVEKFKDSQDIYITIWNEIEVFKLYVNDVVVVESDNKHSIQMEGHRIKKILNKQLNVKVRTNLY